MHIIETIVPISIENLKLYFEDKNKKFIIDYDNSSLVGEKFLVYLSNLELPCDMNFNFENEKHLELLKIYFESKNLVSIPSLERAALSVCFDFKNEKENLFITKNKNLVESWVSILESMILFNFYCVDSEEFKKYVLQFEERDCSKIGLNFVNLLNHQDMNLLLENVQDKNLGYYKDFFNEYMFKGKNLYSYWANENNPMFLLTWAIASDQFKELQSVTSV